MSRQIKRWFSVLRLLTFRRTINLIRLYLGHWRAAFFKSLWLFPPYALSLELTAICNLKCPQCPVGMGLVCRESKMMEKHTAMKILDEFAVYGLIVNLYFQGEPLLHQDFASIARFAGEKRLFTILSTNGTLIDAAMANDLVAAGVHRVIVSADGLLQGTYEKYRKGGRAEKVWHGIGLLAGARREQKRIWPEIIVQTLVHRYNEHELDAIEEKAKLLGADRVQFKTMQIYTGHDQWAPRNKRYRRYVDGQVKKQRKGRCFRAYSGMVVTADGVYVPCCYDKEARIDLGKKSFSVRQVAGHTPRENFLKSIYVGNQMPGICQNCPEAMQVYKKRKAW